MKALRFNALGDLNALTLEDCTVPKAAAGQALVEVMAAGLNPSDVKNVLGRFPYTTLPRTPGRDFAGKVVEGPQEWIGKLVWGTGRDLGFDRDGSHAQFLTLPIAGLAEKPASLGIADAASCGVPYTTAWDALERSHVSADTRVVIIGANGAVGQAALGLAQARRARVVAAVRNPHQAEQLAGQGIRTLTLADGKAFAGQVKQHFADGADVIFDTTGFWLEAAVPALGRFGRLAAIAAPASGTVELPLLNLYRRGGSVVGVNSLLYDSADCAPVLDAIGQLFDSGELAPPQPVSQVPFSQALESYRRVDQGLSTKQVFMMDS
ncbi:MAG: zinc-binding alcohol dehydrogenase family protein [Alcanivorax sp.]|nr:zinc-binding alcohol dehydrogenase family protein [Alcanivorax sp.]